MTTNQTTRRRARGGAGIEVVRAYEQADRNAGCRVLVDRLWPRGVTKADAALDEWAREVAPSAELRRWYGHEPDRFEEFARRYRVELGQQPAADAVARLVGQARAEPLILVTATRDVEHSGAQVLRDHLREKSRDARGRRPARPAKSE